MTKERERKSKRRMVNGDVVSFLVTVDGGPWLLVFSGGEGRRRASLVSIVSNDSGGNVQEMVMFDNVATVERVEGGEWLKVKFVRTSQGMAREVILKPRYARDTDRILLLLISLQLDVLTKDGSSSRGAELQAGIVSTLWKRLFPSLMDVIEIDGWFDSEASDDVGWKSGYAIGLDQDHFCVATKVSFLWVNGLLFLPCICC